jgi:hypothetical protein
MKEHIVQPERLSLSGSHMPKLKKNRKGHG